MTLTRDQVLSMMAVFGGTVLFGLALVWVIDWLGGDKK